MKKLFLFVIGLLFLTFIGCKKEKQILSPTVATAEVSEITSSTAACGGEVTADGGAAVTARGVCWSVKEQPTLADAHTTDGEGIGPFISDIMGLEAGTQYYVRAYATNSSGTSYGEQRCFETENNGNDVVTVTVNGVSFEMIKVEGGTFEMGATSEQGGDAFDNEKPVHSVTLNDFYIGKFEVTQELWEAVMGDNPSYYSGSSLPVEMVSWNDCVYFIENLNEMTGMAFRMPTEAEWEYAARGGRMSQGYKYSGSNNADDVAWCETNCTWETHPVGTKMPNELGVYDMSGNVYEMCSDYLGNYGSEPQTDPQGPATGTTRVVRGGGWIDNMAYCRVSFRNSTDPAGSGINVGLRLALEQ